MHWLGRQKTLLGELAFERLVRAHLNEQSTEWLIQLLNHQDADKPQT